MTTQILLKPKHNGLFDCMIHDVSENQSFSAELGDIAERLQAFSRTVVTLLIPGFDAVYRPVNFADKELKHLSKTIPYSLEDDLLGDIDETHIVLNKPEQNRVMVTAVETGYFQSLLQQCQQHGIEINACYAEQALLSSQPWSVYFSQETCFLVVDAEHIYALDAACLASALASETDEYANLPSNIHVYLVGDQSPEEVLAWLPDSLHHLVDFESSDYAHTMQAGIKQNKAMSLLQGMYAPVQAWSKMWKFWRGVLILLLCVVLIQLGLKVFQNQQLQAENARLVSAQKKMVREVFPRGQLPRPKRQLENELKRLQGGATDASLLKFLAGAGAGLEAAQGLAIKTINYDADKAEMRLDLVINNFSELDKAKQLLEKSGYALVLQNSNAQEDKLRARVLIKNKQ